MRFTAEQILDKKQWSESHVLDRIIDQAARDAEVVEQLVGMEAEIGAYQLSHACTPRLEAIITDVLALIAHAKAGRS